VIYYFTSFVCIPSEFYHNITLTKLTNNSSNIWNSLHPTFRKSASFQVTSNHTQLTRNKICLLFCLQIVNSYEVRKYGNWDNHSIQLIWDLVSSLLNTTKCKEYRNTNSHKTTMNQVELWYITSPVSFEYPLKFCHNTTLIKLTNNSSNIWNSLHSTFIKSISIQLASKYTQLTSNKIPLLISLQRPHSYELRKFGNWNNHNIQLIWITKTQN